MDLAVGIMIGAAFNSIVQSLVKDIMTPFIGIFLDADSMTEWAWKFNVSGANGAQKEVLVAYGKFLQAGINFLILAIIVFFIVKALSSLKKKAEDPSNVETPTPQDILLLSEIRDLLKK